MTSTTGRVVVNGSPYGIDISEGRYLLAWLRDELGLTGTKYGCGEGACGACSVLIDGILARACVVPLDEVVGCAVTTIEGLATSDALHPVQLAFVEEAAMQCGYCTPGMVIAASALLDASPQPTDEEIERWMAPNVCRCCCYPRIVAAIRRASGPVETNVVLSPPPDEVMARPPRAPWDLVAIEDRDYFDVLGDGLVVVSPPPATAPGMWTPTGGAWLHVSTEGRVTAFTGKVEVGQGTRRALRIVVSEELDIPIEDVRLVMGDTDVCPFDIGTFGSMSMPIAARDLRLAAAAARDALRRGGPIEPGVRRLDVVAPDQTLRPATAWRGAGHGIRSGDPTAVAGTKRYVSDITRPGMRHGKVIRPPRSGAQLRSVDLAQTRGLPGVTVVAEDGFVGVVAPTDEAASAAIETIDADWELGDVVAEADIDAHLRAHPASVEGWAGDFEEEFGDFDGAFAIAPVTLAHTYTTSYIAHAPIETRCAVAEWADERLTVWAGTQQPFGVRHELAEALDVNEACIRVIVPDTGTGFGGKHDPDVAIAAARLARAAGAPVKLQWTREEEFTWAYFRPAAVIDARVGATLQGRITAWEHVNINSGSAAIGTPYDVPNRKLRFQPAQSPFRQGPYRALAATANNFARESLIDELAHELRIDPLQFRLQNLNDERLVAVLDTAADRFGWRNGQRVAGSGIGVAIGVEKGGRVATCVQVRVESEQFEITRVVTTFECGAIVDPDNLANQIEGATIMGLGGALFEAIHFDEGGVSNPQFSSYRVPRFTDVPPIDVVLIDRPDIESAGAGETPIIAIAPAIANAFFDATRHRIRSLPLLDTTSIVPGSGATPG